MSHHRLVGGWLNDLAILTAGNGRVEDQRAKVAAMTAVMADAFPMPAAFTKESLYAIGKQNNFFPSFGDLHRQLSAWWDTQRPRTFTVPPELATAPLSSEDRAQVAAWLRAQIGGSVSAVDLRLRLGVVRRYAPAGFEWLVRHDLAAAGMAVRAGWGDAATEPEIREQVSTDWKNPEIVRETAGKYATDSVAIGLLIGLVEKWAPENVSIIHAITAAAGQRQPPADQGSAA
jgi:hypothetical protein